MSSADAWPEGGPTTTLRGALLAVAVGLVILLAVSEVTVRILMPHWREFYSGHFMRGLPVGGYGTVLTGRPGFDGHFAQNNGDFRVHVRINDFGLRNEEAVGEADDRIWVVGDSMTFGWGVERAEMYSSVLAQYAGINTYNIASPGTDVCGYQALVARMPASTQPRALVVGLVLENDISQYNCPRGKAEPGKPVDSGVIGNLQLPTIKRFLTRHLALYNFFAVAIKRVDIVSALLVEFGFIEKEHNATSQPDPSRLRTMVESTADELVFLRGLRTKNRPFVVLVIPARFEIRDENPQFAALRRRMIEALADRNIVTIDVLSDFRQAEFKSTHFAHDGHWNPRGHEIAASAVASWAGSVLPKLER